jgi:predicted amidohydrolase
MKKAAGMGADLVVFPELSLTGYACGDSFFEVAEPVPGPSTDRVAAAGRRVGVAILRRASQS